MDFMLKKGEFILKNGFLMMKIYEWKKKSSWHLKLSSVILPSVYMENVSPTERLGLSLVYFFLKKIVKTVRRVL